MARAATAPALQAAEITNFSGGPNFRDSPSELAANEAYGSWNCTYDERGGVASRLGYAKRNAVPLGGLGDRIVNDFYSDKLVAFVTQAGKKLYVADNTTPAFTFSTADCATFAEMDNYLIVGHPVDGIFYTTDGATWTPLVAAKTITGAANNGAGLIRITAAGHGFATGNKVTVAGVTGTTEANGTWTVTVVDVNNLDLQASTFTNAYVAGGTATRANAPTTALCLAVWQAKLWVGLSDGSVHWSHAGDILTWDSTDFNEIWTKDQDPIVALHVGSGQDIQGRPGLLAFKQESVYRINNPATGAYTVVDATVGAGGPKAVVGVGARVVWIGKRGIFWWREDHAAPVNASDLLRPVWRPEQLSIANQSGWCAGRRLGRVYLSCSTVNSTVNDLAFEFHPDEGWLAPRSDAVTCYSTSTGNNEKTCGGAPSADGQMWTLDTGGTDDGAAIAWWFQTRWIIPNGGFQSTLWQTRLHGRGVGTLTVRSNYEDAGGTAYAFNLAQQTIEYDTGLLYDSGLSTLVYQEDTLQETEAFYDLGTVRQFSLRLSGSSTTTATGRALFGTALNPVVGYFALYGLEYLHVPLGLS